MNTAPQPTNPPPRAAGDAGAGARRCDMLTAMAAAGRADGINAAAWWQQDAIGGRTTGDRTPTARRMLTGLDDIDPQVIDALPRPDLHDEAPLREAYDHYTDPGAPSWDDLDPTERDLACEAYLDAFHTAVPDAVAGHCRDLLGNTATAGGTR